MSVGPTSNLNSALSIPLHHPTVLLAFLMIFPLNLILQVGTGCSLFQMSLPFEDGHFYGLLAHTMQQTVK